MIIVAIICTILGGALGAFLEPVSFSVSIPIAIMGGFSMQAALVFVVKTIDHHLQHIQEYPLAGILRPCRLRPMY